MYLIDMKYFFIDFDVILKIFYICLYMMNVFFMLSLCVFLKLKLFWIIELIGIKIWIM